MDMPVQTTLNPFLPSKIVHFISRDYYHIWIFWEIFFTCSSLLYNQNFFHAAHKYRLMSEAMATTSIRLRRGRRRLSAPSVPRLPRLQICRQARPYSLEALDLSTASPIQTLASLRFLILSYLADLEDRLSRLASPMSDRGIAEILKAHGESTFEEARAWAKVALEMLDSIRADVRSHLPEFHFADLSVEDFVKSHLPDMPDVPRLGDVRSRLPDMPDVRSHLPEMPNVRSHLPDMPDVRSHLPEFTLTDMRSKLYDVRTRFSDMDFNHPLYFIPTLRERLQSLHSHLSSMDLPSNFEVSSLAPSTVLSDLLETLLHSDIFSDLLNVSPDSSAEDILGRAAKEVTDAVKRSLHGARLIKYVDLPMQWRNNPFVRQGYR
jgi:adiponectin receptor